MTVGSWGWNLLVQLLVFAAGLWLLEAKQLLICAQEGSQILGISGLKNFRPPFFQNPKWPPPPFWKFCDITKIMSDISFPMCFGPLNTMQVLIFRFEYNLTPKSPVNGFILAKNSHFWVYSYRVAIFDNFYIYCLLPKIIWCFFLLKYIYFLSFAFIVFEL